MTRIASFLPFLLVAVGRADPVFSKAASDDVAENANLAHGATIPRLIIQTGPKDAVRRGAGWESYQLSLKSMNPNFEYLYFGDDAALAFVDKHFADTDLPLIYRDAPRFVLKADLFRYAAVKVLGGFYMDMDMMAKSTFEPIVQDSLQHGAVFPREWWRSDGAYRKIYGRGRACPDEEEHWQVGNYAFAAVPNHPFIDDALDEAMARTARLIERSAEDETAIISDNDILLSTGPYMLSELYHEGRRNGKYADVAHILGDDDAPFRHRSYGGNDWHKFGEYAEHMLTHSWVTPSRRRMRDLYDVYGTYDTYEGEERFYECLLACPGVSSIEDVYMILGESTDLYYGTESSDLYYGTESNDLYYGADLGECIEACMDTYGADEYGAADMYGTDEYGATDTYGADEYGTTDTYVADEQQISALRRLRNQSAI